MSNKSKIHSRKTRRYELRWTEDHELHGAEVTCRAMRMGELEELGGMYDQFKGFEAEADGESNPGAKLKLLGEMMDRLGGILVWWNMPDEDTMKWNEETEEFEVTSETQVLPADAAGLRKLEDWEFIAILEGYFNNAVGVSADLGKGSNSGASSLAELPMTEQ